MKILIALLLLCCTATAQPIRLTGSDTMLPLLKQLSALYSSQENIPIEVAGGGSLFGMKGMEGGTADIALSSTKLSSKNMAVKGVTIAYDALCIVVHKSNPVGKLTISQLKDIFSGKINNWKILNGPDQLITVYGRNYLSGTYAFMQDYILKGAAFGACQEKPSNAGIVYAVSHDKGGIGYVGFSHIDDSIKPLSVSLGEGRPYWVPTFKNAMEKNYPLVRPLYCYYVPKKRQAVDGFISFLLSVAGQRQTSSSGFIPGAL